VAGEPPPLEPEAYHRRTGCFLHPSYWPAKLGGLDAARTVLLPFIDQDIQAGFTPQRVVDAKSRLQHVTQARFESTPVYNVVDHTGPGHAPMFVVEVKAGPEILARGTGHSKRAAQQAAAHAALQQLNVTEGYEEPQDDEAGGEEDEDEDEDEERPEAEEHERPED